MSSPPDIPPVEDKRPRIAGLLPKNTQGVVLAGVAFVMTLVILFSGRSTPKPKPPSTTASNAVQEPSQARIQEYRARIEEHLRRLAAEEAELAQAKASTPKETAPAMPATIMPTQSGPVPKYAIGYGMPAARPATESDWNRELKKREYQSLFASNIALSYRRDTAANLAMPPTEKRDLPQEPRADSAHDMNPAADSPPQYRLFEGTILETVLTNRLDSSFSGPINCMVTTPVYSHDGAKLLVPAGTRVLGEVRKLQSFGEQRLAVGFHRIIMPDGYSVSLDQFKGLDQIGETGLRDQVNHHYLQIFGVSIALGAFAGLTQANTRYSLDQSALEAYRQGVASSVGQAAIHVLDRYLNVLPTFTVREGYRIKIYLSQDLLLPAVEDHPVRSDL